MNIYRDVLNCRCEEEFPFVAEEHDRQVEKWGYQNHSLFEWMTYLTEEVGESAQAISEYEYREGTAEDAIKELVQVAALATRMMAIMRQNRKEQG